MAGFNALLVRQDRKNYMVPDSDSFRLTLRLAEFSASYDWRYRAFFYDYFGFLDDYKRLTVPKPDSTLLLDACLERARQLSGCNLLVSGGVDSTFVLACFKAAGADVKLYNYCPVTNRLPVKLRKFLESKCGLVYLKTVQEIGRLKEAYMGTLADSLFFSTHRLKDMRTSRKVVNRDGSVDYEIAYHSIPFLPLEDRMLKSKRFSYDEIEMCQAYAALLDRPLDTNNHVARFIDWATCIPKHMLQSSFGYFPGLDSFFNTQKFFNISYTQYWEANNFCPHSKKFFRDFIREVFGTDFGVHKNWT